MRTQPIRPAPGHLSPARLLLAFAFALCALCSRAQAEWQQAKYGAVPGGYNFWITLPQDYLASGHPLPVVIFLHGQSLCGNDLNRVKRYGTLDAIAMGRTVEAIVLAPQNPGGAWSPKKINDMLEWTKRHYKVDTTRVSVLGMSLGGYGTLDFAGTYPQKVAAAMALCGGSTLKNPERLGEVPLWIMHGTADRAVSINESKKVVARMQAADADKRLRYDWLQGASHGALARAFYLSQTYDWLLSHSTADPGRPVNRIIPITQADMQQAYTTLGKRAQQILSELDYGDYLIEIPASQ